MRVKLMMVREGRMQKVAIQNPHDVFNFMRQEARYLDREHFWRIGLEIAGEAAARTSEAFRRRHPAIPWKAIVATRYRLIHGYFDVDLDVVWRARVFGRSGSAGIAGILVALRLGYAPG